MIRQREADHIARPHRARGRQRETDAVARDAGLLQPAGGDGAAFGTGQRQGQFVMRHGKAGRIGMGGIGGGGCVIAISIQMQHLHALRCL